MDYEQFKTEFERITGVNLSLYKENQMKRRIDALILKKGLEGYENMMELMRGNLDELESFKHYITINVTEFFRTPDEWEIFEEKALKEILNFKIYGIRPEGEHGGSYEADRGMEENASDENDTGISLWSTACATGEEPYSLAISLAKTIDSITRKDNLDIDGKRIFRNSSIYATDIDTDVIVKTRQGTYSEQSLSSVSEDLLTKYFKKREYGYDVSDEIKSIVECRHFNLLREEYPKNVDIIVCRNVLIYFTDEAKDAMYRAFYESLKPGGYLFTGHTEQIVYYKKYGYKKIKNFLYQKPFV